MDICTIFAKNYAAQARVLARSFREHHPDGTCYALVLDDFAGYIDPSLEPFTLLTPQEIGCGPFVEMTARYELIELATAVKPWLLLHLLDRGASVITYLDPDIRIYSSLAELNALARDEGVVVTPHISKPLPDDEMRPNEVDLLLAGVYNLGYLSLGDTAQTRALLSWWSVRLERECRFDPNNGRFVDQRWFDLMPGFLERFAIVREPQYNVAYWNLHTRTLAYADGSYTIDGNELCFFHFSGFDPAAPQSLSRHQSRVHLATDPVLAELCREYAEAVFAEGYAETSHWPYSYARLPTGVDFDRTLRRLHELGSDQGAVVGSPFSDSGYASFVAWLEETAPGAPPGVNRLLAELYGTDAELRAAFPHDLPAGHIGLLRWAQEEGAQRAPLLALLPQPPIEQFGGRERMLGPLRRMPWLANLARRRTVSASSHARHK